MRSRPTLVLLLLLLLPAPLSAAPPDARLVRDLVAQLADADSPPRGRAEAALRRLGADAVPSLERALDAARSAEVCCRLERVLLAVDPVVPKVRELVPRLDDDSFDVRQRASEDL